MSTLTTWNDEIDYSALDVIASAIAPACGREDFSERPMPADEFSEDFSEAEITRNDLTPVPAPLALSTFGHQVSAGAAVVDLVALESEILARAGIQVGRGDLYYDEGTALADIGHTALAGYDEQYRALPDADQAVADFQSMIKREAREDVIRDVIRGSLDRDGLLDLDGIPLSVPDRSVAWRQLAEVAGSPNINAGLRAKQAAGKSADRRVRTRIASGGNGREAFGIVTTDPVRGYAVFDGPAVADMLIQGLKARGLASGSKVAITYDRDSTRYQIRAVIQAPIDIPALWGVGRAHQLYTEITGGDSGMHSLEGGAGCIRIRCLNASTADVQGSRWRRTHKGNLRDVIGLVSAQVDSFGEVAESLRGAWSEAAANHYLDTDGTQLSVQEAISRLVAHGHVPTGGLDNEQAVDRFMDAWRAEETPTSAAGILMAIQRAAHEGTWATKWSTVELEESASQLLYQNVYSLPEIELD